jgi:hypothetical protein
MDYVLSGHQHNPWIVESIAVVFFRFKFVGVTALHTHAPGPLGVCHRALNFEELASAANVEVRGAIGGPAKYNFVRPSLVVREHLEWAQLFVPSLRRGFDAHHRGQAWIDATEILDFSSYAPQLPKSVPLATLKRLKVELRFDHGQVLNPDGDTIFH